MMVTASDLTLRCPVPGSLLDQSVLRKIPSPCYVLDERSLRRNLELIAGVGRAAQVRIILALKAFAMWSAFPIFREYISGATASSLAEARLVGEEFGAMSHTYAPVYTYRDFEELLRYSSHVTFNSLGQYERFAPAALIRGISCGLRINPECSTVATDLYDPCSPGSRLGVTADELEGLSAAGGGGSLESGGAVGSSAAGEGAAGASRRGERDGERLRSTGRQAGASSTFSTACQGRDGGDGLPAGLDGFHFHTLCESGPEELRTTLEAVEARFGRWLPSLRWINMGGGHLITREGYDTGGLVALLRDFKQRHPNLEVILEPGSAFTWRTGWLVATVEDKIERGGVNTLMVDVSFACHMPDCLEMPYKPAIVGAHDPAPDLRPDQDPASSPAPHSGSSPVPRPGEKRWRVGGNCCLAGDFVGDWVFDHEPQVGDRLVLEDMMHYTMVKTTMFNGVAHPSMAILRADGTLDVVREFGYEDYKSRMG